ncbi:MAG: SpoIIE family protein phosphatase [Thermodesulfobacteriota bacterium]
MRRGESKDLVTVLVVDDSRTMRNLLERLLTDFAYTVLTAEDGEEALQVYGKAAPDIILLDMNMPRLDGLGVINAIRGEHGDQETLIIMVTSIESQGLKLSAFSAGVNDFLNKPFDRAELLARVAAAARQVRLNRSLRQAAETIAAEMDLVASLQTRLLPAAPPDMAGIAVQSIYRPSGRASGDYFDHFTIADGVLRAVVADVSGHGARAAFLMGIVRTLFHLGRTHSLRLTDTLALINSHLMDILGNEPDFVSVLAADIDLRRGRLTYVNAGHPPGMLRIGEEAVALAATSPVLGFFDLTFEPRVLDLPPDSGLFLFTDGFYDWEMAPGELMDFDAFWDLAAGVEATGGFLEEVLALVEWKKLPHGKFRDDVSALWIRVAPGAAPAPGGREREPCVEEGGAAREYRLRTRAAAPAARRLTRAVLALAADHVSGEAVLYDLGLALSEACANVVEHAYPQGEPGDLEILLRVIPGDRVEAEVRDFGPGFALDPAVLGAPQPDAESGRGMYIISRLMDEMAVLREGDATVVRFAKRIGRDAWKTCA